MSAKREQFINGKGKSKTIYIFGAAAVLIIIIIALYFGLSSKSAAVKPDPREAKYIGRYLPQGFKAAQLIEPIKYDQRLEMTDIKASVQDGNVSIKVGDVIKDRIVFFEYKRPSDGQTLPMIAYIKPSGRLFTGVSLCAPCRAERQYIDTDGLLTCGSCGTKRDLETQVGISGACRLYPLDELGHKLVGDNIQIAAGDLARWSPQPLDRPVGQ